MDEKMKLMNEYYQYVLKEKSMSPAKSILFDLVHDFTDRRGIRGTWENIDMIVREEILETWLHIIEKHI